MRRRRIRVARSRRSRAARPDNTRTLLLAAGAVAGAAASVYLGRRYGGLAAIASEMRAGVRGFRDYWLVDGDSIDEEHDRPLGSRRASDLQTQDSDADRVELSNGASASFLSPETPVVQRSERALEARVLAAFEEDEILSRRAVEISALGEGVIELSGWVHSTEEAVRAAAVARAVSGVEMVLNRVSVRGGGHLGTASTGLQGDDEESSSAGGNGGLDTN